VIRGDASTVDDLAALFAVADAAFVLLRENPADTKFVATRPAISRALARALGESRVRQMVPVSAVGADRPEVVGPALRGAGRRPC
jgi:hypothetical protein